MRVLPLLALLAAASPTFAEGETDAPAKKAPAKIKAPANAVFGAHPALPVKPKLGSKKTLAALKAYKVPASKFWVKLGKPLVGKRISQQPVTFPSPISARWPVIHGTYYRPLRLKKGQRVPAAVVVHHLGGSFEAEAILAQHLATNGVAAFFISLPNYGKRQEPKTKQGFMRLGPLIAFRTFQQAALDVIRAGDFLRSRPEVDPRRVGAVGVSLGAFVTAVARGVDPRLKKTVLILGGGDLLSLLDHAPKEAGDLLKKVKIPRKALKGILAPVDPITFASRVKTKDVLMLNAKNDEIVPVHSAKELWKAFGRPKIQWFNCGHYGVVLHILTVMNTTLDHLKDAPVTGSPTRP